MKVFEKALSEHLRLHPRACAQDAVKFCYQAARGAEHLLSDSVAGRKFFFEEFGEVKAADGEKWVPLYENLSEGYLRVNFAAWKAAGMKAEWLWNMFLFTVNGAAERRISASGVENDGGAEDVLDRYLEIAGRVYAEARGEAGGQEWEKYIEVYRKMGKPALHHSDGYHEFEKPAYRVVAREFEPAIRVLKAVAETRATGASDKVSAGEKTGAGVSECDGENANAGASEGERAGAGEREVKVVAIEGRAAAGKSTLAQVLRDVAGAAVVHADDFFLPPEMRTEDRIGAKAAPGGNVHYERMIAEVLPRLREDEAFGYRVFDCATMRYGGTRVVPRSEIRVVEGSYVSHPALGDYADVRVFVDVAQDEQLRRIEKRNGPRAAINFRNRWIPMEERFFAGVNLMKFVRIET